VEQAPSNFEHDPLERPQGRREWSGPLRSIVLPLGILAIIVGGLWYWDERQSETGGAYDETFGVVELPEDRNVTGESPAAEVGRAAPDFLLEQPAGGTLRLSDLQGKPVLVNFWASWCTPCRSEMPELVKTYERYQDQGLVIVGVDLQETDRQVTDFAEEFGVDFPLVVDRDSEVADSWRIGGPIEGLPSSYFLDAEGVVQERFYGPLDEESLDEKLSSILPGAGS
jgi:peroxiredoxin